MFAFPQCPKRTLWPALALFMVVVAAVSACGDKAVGPDAEEDSTARVFVLAGINPSLPVEGSLPIHKVFVYGHLVSDSSEVGVVRADVDSTQLNWLIELELDLPKPWDEEREVYVTVGLLKTLWSEDGMSATSISTWSGVSSPFTVKSGEAYTIPRIDMWRGSFGNWGVVAVALDPIPQLTVGEQALLRTSLTTVEPPPSTYVRALVVSLDTAVAVVPEYQNEPGIYLTAVSPGTARIMAIAGRVADTITVDVVTGTGAGAR